MAGNDNINVLPCNCQDIALGYIIFNSEWFIRKTGIFPNKEGCEMSLNLAKKKGDGNGSTDRVKKLNVQQRSARLTISLVRARAYTEVYKTTEPLPPILRRAMATSKALDTTPPYILEGELVIGSESSALKAYPIHPELESNWIMMEGGLAAMCSSRKKSVLIGRIRR
jgi:hypothetical protein